MILVAVCAFVVLAAIKLVVLAALFAVLIGGTFLPVVDWLARHHVKRWIAAFLVVIFLILLAVGICLVVLYGLVNQWPEIQDNLQQAWDSIQKSLSSTSVSKEQMDSAKAALQTGLKNVASGATSAVGDLIGGVAGLIFGIFISINILVWVLIQGRQIGGWASKHMPPVPQPVAYAMLANSARFFRGYIYGSTIVGLFNGMVIFVGALIIGVPLAATLGIVAWMTELHPVFRRHHQRRVRRARRLGRRRTVHGRPDADHRHHRQRVPADAGLPVRPRVGAEPPPALGALRDHRRRHPLRRRGRRLRGALPEDRGRLLTGS